MARLLLLLALLIALPLHAAPGKDTLASAGKWTDMRMLIGRLEEEYDRMLILQDEVGRLRNACEDLRLLQLYPEGLTRLKDSSAVALDKTIRAKEGQVAGFETGCEELRRPLLDAIAMTKELVYEDPQASMLAMLSDESKARVLRILQLKRQLNALWKTQDLLLDRLYAMAGLPVASPADSNGFDAEFFQVIYSNLGMSSDLFLRRLNAYKDSLSLKMDAKTLPQIAGLELAAAEKRFRNGKTADAERDLLAIARRYEQRIVLNGVYYYLGQVSQMLNKNREAVDYYSQIARTSPYFIKGVAGILQAHYSKGEYDRVVELFGKMQPEFKDTAGLNPVLFVVSQALYELGRDAAMIELSARAEKEKPYYLGILYTLGQSYTRKGDLMTARSIFRTVADARRVPASDQSFVNLARLSIAHLDYSEGAYGQALKAYLGFLDNEALFAEALRGIAWCYLSLGNYEKAEIALKRLVNQAPAEPLGCEALLLLSENCLKKAKGEWQFRSEQQKNLRRIQAYLRLVERRRQAGEIDSLQYAGAVTRLKALLKENKAEENVKTEDVAALYGRSQESLDLLVGSYQSGDFVRNPFKDQKQELLIRIRDLDARSRASQARVAQPLEDRVRREADGKRRADILATVLKARLFRVKLSMERREWQVEYGQFFAQSIDAKLDALKGDSAMNDSARAASRARLETTRTAILRDLDYTAAMEQKETYDELLRLQSAPLDSEQAPFVFYYLAEIRYRTAQDEYLRLDEEYERRMADYEKARAAGDTLVKRPTAPLLDYHRAKADYAALAARYPGSRFADAALYSLMFCNTEEGDKAAAKMWGEKLVSLFPNSDYAPQTYLLLGEFYFDENQLELALRNYREVLRFPGSRWFDKALYKMGWTYYRLSDTKRAISAFFYLINEQDELNENGLDLEAVKKSLLTKESIDYVAISFAEADTIENEIVGLKKALRFVKKIRNDYVGSRILHKLGDVYKEQLKYTHALEAYRELKNGYPDYRDLPTVMYSVIECYEQKSQFQAANDGRRQLFLKYNRNSEWAKAQKDSAAVAYGDSLAEQTLLEAASYTYSLAIEKKNKDMYRQVIDMYWDYIKTYPEKDKASECHYYIAEILFGAGDYLEAARQYIEVSRKYRTSKYCETAAMNAIVAAQNLLKQEEQQKGSGQAPEAKP
ncbi:MAG: tetratricopeptide repeat protein [Fibrobacterota bacterium]